MWCKTRFCKTCKTTRKRGKSNPITITHTHFLWHPIIVCLFFLWLLSSPPLEVSFFLFHFLYAFLSFYCASSLFLSDQLLSRFRTAVPNPLENNIIISLSFLLFSLSLSPLYLSPHFIKKLVFFFIFALFSLFLSLTLSCSLSFFPLVTFFDRLFQSLVQ